MMEGNADRIYKTLEAHGERLVDHSQRLARIEAIIPHLATKAWVLGGVIAGMAIAAGIAATISAAILKWWPS